MSDRELSVRDHLQELRRRLLICVVALLVTTGISFYFFREIIDVLALPARDLGAEEGLELVYTEVTELLTTSIKVSFVAGFILAFPVILYQAIRFVAPGLTEKEKRLLFLFLPLTLLAFAGGVAFGYFVLTPPALRFLLTFGQDVATPLIRVSNLVNLMLRLLLWMGLAFETPLVMFLLAQLGIVNARMLSRFRRYWIIVAFILGALITPTVDPFNQALVALPLIALYEIGVLLAKLAGRRRQQSAEAITPVSELE